VFIRNLDNIAVTCQLCQRRNVGETPANRHRPIGAIVSTISFVSVRDWFRLFSSDALNPDRSYFKEAGDGCSRLSELLVDGQEQTGEALELIGCMFAKTVFESKPTVLMDPQYLGCNLHMIQIYLCKQLHWFFSGAWQIQLYRFAFLADVVVVLCISQQTHTFYI